PTGLTRSTVGNCAGGALCFNKRWCRLWCCFADRLTRIRGSRRLHSTGCERCVAHLLRLAHHCQQRVCIRLLIAGEQRLGVLPAARRGDVLERVMLSLCRPLPAIRVPEPPFELRQLGLPLRDVQPLVEEVSIHRLVEL